MKDLWKIGYLGGTFDPPHLGHEMVAREACSQLDLDTVMWLITPDPPHKTSRKILPVETRLDMLQLVTARYDEFEISKIDLKRSPPYFAADTVEIIKNQQPAIDLVYIIGEDSLEDLHSWYQPDRFLAAIDQLAVAPRPGVMSDLDELGKDLPGLRKKAIFLTEIMVEISSSLIREMIKEGVNLDHFLARDVEEYIKNNNLYK